MSHSKYLLNSNTQDIDGLDSLSYDVAIVGAGPSGLACAIKLKQLNPNLNIAIFEKGNYVGAHNISGCVLEDSSLNQLIPDYAQKLSLKLHTKVTQEQLLFLTDNNSFKLPIPKAWNNYNNYIISLSHLCSALGEYAQALEIDIFAECAIDNVIIENNQVIGILTKDAGVNADGSKSDNYLPAMAIYTKQIVLAEGARGSLTKQVIKHFNLANPNSQASYGLGIKEVWKINPHNHHLGKVIHAIGYPLKNQAYGGGFVYHMNDHLVSIGLVTALDYTNPNLDPYGEFQKLKLHPQIKPILENAKRIEYGARVVTEGGIQSLPKLYFPGGIIIGDSAGFLNVAKIKGVHNAISSGMLGAQAIELAIRNNLNTATDYDDLVKSSKLYQELYKVRNIRPSFKFGIYLGLLYSAIDYYVFRGYAPWTFKFRHTDNDCLTPKQNACLINYPKPDNHITFDKNSSLALSNLTYAENQPTHLKLSNPKVAIELNLNKYGAPETKYCPANVYQIIEINHKPQLQIHSGNCLQCKACDIKDPSQNITWANPESGNGPKYNCG